VLLCSTVFLRSPAIYMVDIEQLSVRDGDTESWQFITCIQLHPEVIFGAVLYR